MWSAAVWGSAWWWSQRGDSGSLSRADAEAWQDVGPVTEPLDKQVVAERQARQARDKLFDGYVEPEELAGWLLAGRRGLAVVDVRDCDFRAARTRRRKIAGAWHEPAHELRTSDAAPLVGALRGADAVVFHCMYSQQRGPACAQQYAQRRRELAKLAPLPPQEVLVLRGGFAKFHRRYGSGADANTLFEGVGPQSNRGCAAQGRTFGVKSG